MKIIVKPGFERDVDRIRSHELRIALAQKISQIEKAKDTSRITGLKQLIGYSSHFRILVKTEKYSYRIGAVVRGDAIWLVRFLPRRIVYKRFP